MLHEGERATDASEMGPYGARSSRSRARPEIGNIANLIAHVCWRDGRGLKKLISLSHEDMEKSI